MCPEWTPQIPPPPSWSKTPYWTSISLLKESTDFLYPLSDYTLPHFSDQALSTLTVPGHITVMGTWGVSSTATLDFSCFSLEVITTRSDLSLQSLVAIPSFCLNSKISLKFLTYLCRLLSLLITSFSWAESTFSWLTGPAQHLKQNRCRINKWMKEDGEKGCHWLSTWQILRAPLATRTRSLETMIPQAFLLKQEQMGEKPFPVGVFYPCPAPSVKPRITYCHNVMTDESCKIKFKLILQFCV